MPIASLRPKRGTPAYTPETADILCLQRFTCIAARVHIFQLRKDSNAANDRRCTDSRTGQCHGAVSAGGALAGRSGSEASVEIALVLAGSRTACAGSRRY